MTYEPGTSDIFTTGDVPFPGPTEEELTDDQVLASLMRRILNNPEGFKASYRGGAFGEQRRLMMTTVARTLELTTREYEVAVAAGPPRHAYWFDL